MSSDCEDINQYRIFLETLSSVPEVLRSDLLRQNTVTYTVCPDELKGEILTCILNHLETKNCPTKLLVPIALNTLDEVEKECKKSECCCDYTIPSSTGAGDLRLYDITKLHKFTISSLQNFAARLLDNVEMNKILPKSSASDAIDNNQSHGSGNVATPKHVVGAIRNKRRSMEDRYICIDRFNELYKLRDTRPSSFYGIFDGHCGMHAATYAAAQVPKILADSLNGSADNCHAHKIQALKTSIMQTDKNVSHKTMPGGSTAVCALYCPAESYLYVVWVGDSKAMLVKQRNVMQLVKPHKPSSPEEQARIRASFGNLMLIKGEWRINGLLNVSRAIGDREYPSVISNPDCVCVELDKQEDFLIMATDGLWDHAKEDEIAATVYQAIQQDCDNVDQIPKLLIDLAKKGNSSDNITVVVIFLKQPCQIAKNCGNSEAMDSTFKTTEMDDFLEERQRELYGHGFPKNSKFGEEALDQFDLSWNNKSTKTGDKDSAVSAAAAVETLTTITTKAITENLNSDDDDGSNLEFSNNFDLNQRKFTTTTQHQDDDDNFNHLQSPVHSYDGNSDAYEGHGGVIGNDNLELTGTTTMTTNQNDDFLQLHHHFDHQHNEQNELDNNIHHQQQQFEGGALTGDNDFGPETCVDVTDDIVMVTENSADTNLLDQSTLSHSKDDTLPSSADNFNPFDNRNVIAPELDANKATPLLSPEVEDLPLSDADDNEEFTQQQQQLQCDSDIQSMKDEDKIQADNGENVAEQSPVFEQNYFMQANGHRSPVAVAPEIVEKVPITADDIVVKEQEEEEIGCCDDEEEEDGGKSTAELSMSDNENERYGGSDEIVEGFAAKVEEKGEETPSPKEMEQLEAYDVPVELQQQDNNDDDRDLHYAGADKMLQEEEKPDQEDIESELIENVKAAISPSPFIEEDDNMTSYNQDGAEDNLKAMTMTDDFMGGQHKDEDDDDDNIRFEKDFTGGTAVKECHEFKEDLEAANEHIRSLCINEASSNADKEVLCRPEEESHGNSDSVGENFEIEIEDGGDFRLKEEEETLEKHHVEEVSHSEPMSSAVAAGIQDNEEEEIFSGKRESEEINEYHDEELSIEPTVTKSEEVIHSAPMSAAAAGIQDKEEDAILFGKHDSGEINEYHDKELSVEPTVTNAKGEDAVFSCEHESEEIHEYHDEKLSDQQTITTAGEEQFILEEKPILANICAVEEEHQNENEFTPEKMDEEQKESEQERQSFNFEEIQSENVADDHKELPKVQDDEHAPSSEQHNQEVFELQNNINNKLELDDIHEDHIQDQQAPSAEQQQTQHDQEICDLQNYLKNEPQLDDIHEEEHQIEFEHETHEQADHQEKLELDHDKDYFREDENEQKVTEGAEEDHQKYIEFVGFEKIERPFETEELSPADEIIDQDIQTISSPEEKYETDLTTQQVDDTFEVNETPGTSSINLQEEEPIGEPIERETIIQDQSSLPVSTEQQQLHPVVDFTTGASPQHHEVSGCDESGEDEWKYIKEVQSEKQELEQQQEHHQQHQLIQEEKDLIISEEVADNRHFEVDALNAGKPLVSAEEDILQCVYDSPLLAASPQPTVIVDKSEDSAFSNLLLSNRQGEEQEEAAQIHNNQQKQLQFTEEADDDVDKAVAEAADLAEMNSNLNPEAKEFIPSFSPPSSQTIQFNEQPQLSNGKEPAVALRTPVPHHLLDDVIVAQSPRKGRESNMENISIPAEIEFSVDIASRPHGNTEEEDPLLLESGGSGDGKIAVNESYQEMNLKEAMHAFEKDEVALLDSPPANMPTGAVENLLVYEAPVGLDNAGMKQSIYIENTHEVVDDNDLLNKVQPLPTDADSNTSFEITAEENGSATNKEKLSIGVEEKDQVSPSIEEMNEIITLKETETTENHEEKETFEQKMEQLSLSEDIIAKDVHVDVNMAAQQPINGVEMSPSGSTAADAQPLLQFDVTAEEAVEATPETAKPSNDSVTSAATIISGVAAATAVAATIEAEKNAKNLTKSAAATKNKVPDTKKQVTATKTTSATSSAPTKRLAATTTAAARKPTTGTSTTASKPRTTPAVAKTTGLTEKKTSSTTSTVKSRIDSKPPLTLAARKPLGGASKQTSSTNATATKTQLTSKTGVTAAKTATLSRITSTSVTTKTRTGTSSTTAAAATTATTNGSGAKAAATAPSKTHGSATKAGGLAPATTRSALTSPRSTLSSQLRKTEAIKSPTKTAAATTATSRVNSNGTTKTTTTTRASTTSSATTKSTTVSSSRTSTTSASAATTTTATSAPRRPTTSGGGTTLKTTNLVPRKSTPIKKPTAGSAHATPIGRKSVGGKVDTTGATAAAAAAASNKITKITKEAEASISNAITETITTATTTTTTLIGENKQNGSASPDVDMATEASEMTSLPSSAAAAPNQIIEMMETA